MPRYQIETTGNGAFVTAFEAAIDRMEAVAKRIPIENRNKRVSPATHVAHMAHHLALHAAIARKAIAKATGEAVQS